MAPPAPAGVRTPRVIQRAVVVAALAGCGGGSQRTPTRPPASPSAVEDLTIDLPTATMTGQVLVPEAMPAPPLPEVRPRRKTTLERQRATWRKLVADGRASESRRASEAQVLTTLLVAAARELPADAPARAALVAEARTALAVLVTAGKPDHTTLQMALALALADGDTAGAAPLLEALATRFTDLPSADDARARLALAALVAGKDADARGWLGDRQPTAAAPGLAYAIAWVRFRAGDNPGAADAIAAAAAGWRDEATRPRLLRDHATMVSRAGVSPAVAAESLGAATTAAERPAALVRLAQAYELAGRPADGVSALELALAAPGALPGPARVDALARAAELTFRADRLEELADRWQAVFAALDACADCPPDTRGHLGADLARTIYALHTIHVTAGDPRPKATALALYRLHARAVGPDEAVAAHLAELERARLPEDGSQYREALQLALGPRLQGVLACYEARLQSVRGLGGVLTLRLEVDAGGQVIGATTEPPAGETGLAAVAACVERDARTWRLPSRPRPGVARIGVPFVLGAPR